jgi:hypothetical protein
MLEIVFLAAQRGVAIDPVWLFIDVLLYKTKSIKNQCGV